MCHYKHLTLIEREKIMFFLAQNYSVTDIAKAIGRNKSTVSREIKRNAKEDYYQPSISHTNYLMRRTACKPHKKLNNPDLYALVKDKFLNHQWSPEEISGRLKHESGKCIISYNTIYRGIYSGMFDEENKSHGNRGAIRKLRHHGKSRHTKDYEERRGKIQISNDITQRPIGATKRSRRGHWEGDTVVGKKGKACLVTLVDRKTRFLVGGKASHKTAANVNVVIIQSLKDHPVKSITPDRGKEFANHKEVTEALDQVQFYFPLPHHPWQRGTNENTNGLLREYFPKGVDITNVSEEYIQAMYDELNKRPRKCLGYKTPYEAYYSTSLHLT